MGVGARFDERPGLVTYAEVIPLFPPGVHDIVVNDLGDGRTEFVCAAGDYAGVVAHTGQPAEMRQARVIAYEHAARHRRVPCHAECVEEPECVYDGETS